MGNGSEYISPKKIYKLTLNMKRCSTALVIREIQITNKIPFHPSQDAYNQRQTHVLTTIWRNWSPHTFCLYRVCKY